MYGNVPPLNEVVVDSTDESPVLTEVGFAEVIGAVSIGFTERLADETGEVEPIESVTMTPIVYGDPAELEDVTMQVVLAVVHVPELTESPEGTVQAYDG